MLTSAQSLEMQPGESHMYRSRTNITAVYVPFQKLTVWLTREPGPTWSHKVACSLNAV